ncbi:N-succinylglutamate 5-semialdehyde dehydrogenase [Rubripirellula amarantea]|uniref:L-glutamate gamma-semialdehyde dehydrogenase n=1 Tax=Rubripirellula amarantea TaxID=2527999 RepID=A0A5C5WQK8_9BACT|nr:aldehyde dehydrogenase family protein [Rubripirellula amarantea]TWT52827.1 N-succinylglutamate 5-semialdehyde dehydrogenase [Rubripirellula amarantea]
METKKNTGKFFSRNPLNQQLLWSGNVSTAEMVTETMEASRQAGLQWRNIKLSDRIAIAEQYSLYLKNHADRFAQLISDETGKLLRDAMGEVNASIAKVGLTIQAIQERRSETVVDQMNVTRNSQSISIDRRLSFAPLGVALVLGPFNFPLHLPGGQIIPALLAGNSVVFKPSEFATAVGAEMVAAWHECGLPKDCLTMLVGDRDVAKLAIDAEQTSAVFLTGSRNAGIAIHRQLAGRPEVLLALELGGNNPLVVDTNVPDEDVADLVSFSAFASAGQRCTCARRAIFIQGSSTDSQINALVEKSKNIRAGYPSDVPMAQIGRLISVDAADRMEATYHALIELGCQPIIPCQRDPQKPMLIRPMIVDAQGVSAEGLASIGAMEWFGPLLVVHRVANFDDAIGLANQTSYGLAASLLSDSAENFERFRQSSNAGVVNWNSPTSGAAGVLPFGGRGESGNHRPAGFHAIDFCSDPVASLEASQIASSNLWATVS